MIDIRQQTLSEDLKRQIYEGFSRHAIQMTGYDEKFDTVAFVAMDGMFFVGAIVFERFWGALHIKYVYIDSINRYKPLLTTSKTPLSRRA